MLVNKKVIKLSNLTELLKKYKRIVPGNPLFM